MAEDKNVFASENPPKGSRKSWMWIMMFVNIVFILILMTVGIVALKVGNVLPNNTDILFIVGKNPSVEVEDEKESWKAQKNVDIFKASYENEQGETTVISQDGTKVIAPGTQTTYKFTMYNSGNMAVVYQTDLDFTLKIGAEVQENYSFPLKVRLKNESGEILVGTENGYENVQDAILNGYVSVLGANSYETFTLELVWDFEGGNDELDTLYGDLACEKGVYLTLGINTYAEEHFDPTAQGGNQIEVEGNIEYGGTFRWLWLIMLMLNVGILIFYISWLMNKRMQKW